MDERTWTSIAGYSLWVPGEEFPEAESVRVHLDDDRNPFFTDRLGNRHRLTGGEPMVAERPNPIKGTSTPVPVTWYRVWVDENLVPFDPQPDVPFPDQAPGKP